MFNSVCCCASATAGDSNSPTAEAAILDIDAPPPISTFNAAPSPAVARKECTRNELPEQLAENGMAAYALSADPLALDMAATKVAARQIWHRAMIAELTSGHALPAISEGPQAAFLNRSAPHQPPR
jgi:hypothetical protein